MMLYALLWRQGMITRPDVTEQRQTVTGNGQKLITGRSRPPSETHAEFTLQKSRWRPVVSTEGAPMKLPDEFGIFPFARFTAEEFRHFCPVCPTPRQ